MTSVSKAVRYVRGGGGDDDDDGGGVCVGGCHCVPVCVQIYTCVCCLHSLF